MLLCTWYFVELYFRSSLLIDPDEGREWVRFHSRLREIPTHLSQHTVAFYTAKTQHRPATLAHHATEVFATFIKRSGDDLCTNYNVSSKGTGLDGAQSVGGL